jgi:fucose 4-O-acetylase-like acetyltransferase
VNVDLNALKGILILLVIIDHNDFSRSIFPGFLYGFGFHVVGFLTIPFLKPAPAWNRDMGPYLFRLYYPFFLIVTVLALVVGISRHVPASEQLQSWLLTLYSGNSALLKQTTGMALLWFIPSFMSLVMLRSVIEHTGVLRKRIAVALLCVAHVFVGSVAVLVRDYLPLGLLPAIYVIPLAYLGVWIHRRLFAGLSPALALLIATALFIPVKYLQMQGHLYYEVGFAEVADFKAPYALLLDDLESVLGVMMLFQLCRFNLGGFLRECGRYSMQIYLFHAFVALGVYKAVVKLMPGAGSILLFTISLTTTALLTLALARWLVRRPLVARFVLPRNPQVLLGLPPASIATPPPHPAHESRT